jgi:hypothetical protein
VPASTGRLVAAKIDNAPLARPYQTGLRKASIVYQELAEGGLTRLLAVFETDKVGTSEVGPVRSARESDVELLREFGQIPLAFSGAQGGVINIINRGQAAGYLFNASYDTLPSAYRLGERRKDARNFYVSPDKVAKARPGSVARDVGLRFGSRVPGTPVTRLMARFAPGSTVIVTPNADGTWSLTQDGRRVAAAPSTVIIQRIITHNTGFKDVHHLPSPYNTTIGHGQAIVLSKGTSTVGSWARNGYGATHFLDATGRDIMLAAGPVWILLVPTSGSINAG